MIEPASWAYYVVYMRMCIIMLSELENITRRMLLVAVSGFLHLGTSKFSSSLYYVVFIIFIKNYCSALIPLVL